MTFSKRLIGLGICLAAMELWAQGSAEVSPAAQAFERGEWAEAIDQYRAILREEPSDGLAMLRVAQAQRELDRHARALETLELARAVNAPEAMVDLERARNLAALGQTEAALRALEASDHAGLRALSLVEDAEELAALRSGERFQRVYRSVRRRVFPCQGVSAARDFDFWLGRWEVRLADGTLVGHNHIRKEDGGCTILERWEGAGGSSGTSVSYFTPSQDRWRQVWAGSGGTLIDISGGLHEGAMRMEGTIEYVGQNRVLAFRGTWTRLADGRVRQFFEQFDLASQAWQTWFEGFYRLQAQP